MNYQDMYKVLTLCVELSPTGVEQRAFSDIANSPFDSYADTTVALLSGLADGLKFGNWPKPVDA